MTKLYSLVLAAAVALSANAATPEVMQINSSKPTLKATATATNIKIEKKADAAQPMKAAAAAANEDKSIDGLYTITIGDYYLAETASEYTADATVVDNGDGTITIECDEFYDAITAEYDAVKGTVTFNASSEREPVKLTTGATYYTAFTPFTWTTDVTPGSYTVNYKDGAFEFPADHGFSWPAYATETATSAAGYFYIFDVLSLEMTDDVLYEDAKWTGNFLTKLFNGTSAVTEPTTTTVIYSDRNKTYTIQDAFCASFAQLGFNTTSPAVKVVATDPDNCIVPEATTNINGGDSDGVYYVLSQSANTNDPSTIAEEYRIKLTDDGETVTIVFPVKSMFLWPSNTTSLYYANQVESKLVIKKPTSGISNIASDDNNQAPVYYNLQGVRVANPEKGLYIEVRGNKATKTIK